MQVMQRRAVRRAVQTRCQAVNTSSFRLIAERVLDISTRGMLVACDAPVLVGDEVMVSFQAPGAPEMWLDAEAVVARVVVGPQWGDAVCVAGLEFTRFEKSGRHELLSRLAGYPPPVPQRRDSRSSGPQAPWALAVRPVAVVPDAIGTAQARSGQNAPVGAPRGAFR